MTKRSGRVRAPQLVLGAVLIGSTLTACGGDEQVAYCVDKNDKIVDESNCDQDNNGGVNPLFWYMVGPYNSGLQPGTQLDRSQGSRISPKNADARAKAGIPKTGKVTTGKSGTYFKPGGFGSFKGSSGT